jgi:hypothetical protein
VDGKSAIKNKNKKNCAFFARRQSKNKKQKAARKKTFAVHEVHVENNKVSPQWPEMM